MCNITYYLEALSSLILPITCVCVRERKRERWGERESERAREWRERARETQRVCRACVWEQESEVHEQKSKRAWCMHAYKCAHQYVLFCRRRRRHTPPPPLPLTGRFTCPLYLGDAQPYP